MVRSARLLGAAPRSWSAMPKTATTMQCAHFTNVEPYARLAASAETVTYYFRVDPGRLLVMSNDAPSRPPRLRSPLSRAVVPVLGGIAFFVALGLATWGIAAYISRGGAEVTERLAPTTLTLGSVYDMAEIVDDDGPIILAGLNTTTGEKTLVLDHQGSDPTRGWQIFYAFPAGQDFSCPVEQVIGSREFIDCDGNRLDVSDLAPPDPGVNPVVENQRSLYIDLSGITTG